MNIDPEQVPMMYRAQVQGRCCLQYGKNQQDLDRWTEEWVYPDLANNKQPSYQFKEPKLGIDGSVYRFKIKFPWRVFSNCGQDSILRPVIGKNGIPFLPGSGIKGLFKRLLENQEFTEKDNQKIKIISDENKKKIKEYCGTENNPGTLRFIRAYPIGDWASTKKVTPQNKPEETRYQMVDICHPQQKTQVIKKDKPQAIALISLHEPTLIFELSSIVPLDETEWQNIEQLFREALNKGIGGKTSSGYGLYNFPQSKYQYPLAFYLRGKGVSPLLRNDEPEFRRNLFKATLRGHCSRLLAGVTDQENLVKTKVNQFFGDTYPGSLQLYWETFPSFLKPDTCGKEKTPVYENKGILYFDIFSDKIQKQKDISFIQKVMEFAFIMGGFGKSWRRVYHRDFFSSYNTRGIGCHWQGEWQKSKEAPFMIEKTDDLRQFLNALFSSCQSYLGVTTSNCVNDWREAWHPERVSVYAQVVSQSQVIDLFHQGTFKTTPAIGGRNPGDDRPKYVSSVWHRMLPIDEAQYLEIITLFYGDRSPWKQHDNHRIQDQLLPFVRAVEQQGLQLIWGKELPE